MNKDLNFYNKESSVYSIKRYPDKITNYYQFLFSKRVHLLLNSLSDKFGNKSMLRLLEIGCADGIIIRKILSKFEKIFAKVIGIDVSSGMINITNKVIKNEKVVFLERKDYDFKEKVDVVVEVGVLNLLNIEKEIGIVADTLKKDSYFFCSVAGKNSLWSILNKTDEYENFWSYKEYETLFKKRFNIEKVYPYGMFIPYIWRIPSIAILVQRFVEFIFQYISPNLFHEKLYILRVK